MRGVWKCKFLLVGQARRALDHLNTILTSRSKMMKATAGA